MISQEIFDHEIAMCKKSHTKRGRCNWGICDSCGVIPLLHKLQSGTIIETPEEIDELKNTAFNS